MKRIKMSESNFGTPEIAKYVSKLKQPLTPEEEFEAAVAKDYNKLIEHNMLFVVSIAKQYSSNREYVMDIIQAGNIGLCQAAPKFDPQRGFKFISFAVWWIRQSIQEFVESHKDTIRLSQNACIEIRKKDRELVKLYSQFDMDAPSSKLAYINLNKKDQEDGNKEYIEVFQNPDEDDFFKNIDSKELKKVIIKAVDSIDCKKKQKDIFKAYLERSKVYCSYEDLALEFGCTRERARQIIIKITNELKHNKILLSYLNKIL